MPDPIRDSENVARSETSARNQQEKPPGILPKNAQTWVIAGLATVMVAVIALSGNGSKNKAPGPGARQAGVIDPNAARIAEYRNRLDEETRKLAAEQATLNQAKQAAAVSDPRIAAAIQPGMGPNAVAMQQPTRSDDRESMKKQLEAERTRKEYSSLFASNVALTLRKDSQENAPNVSAPSPVPMGPAFPNSYQVPPIAPTPNVGAASGGAHGADQVPAHTPPAEIASENRTEIPRAHAEPDPELMRADGEKYRLLEGTILETILTNRLTGSLAGPVNTMLTADVYSHDRQHLLIPRGSRILGEVKPVANFAQQRLAVVFHRIIMPDGYSVSLDQFQGLNQIGETGLRDQVNHHYLEIFGVSIAIGAVAGLSQANTAYGLTESAIDEYRQGFASSLSQSSLRILDRFLNILPTFTIREGHRIKIYLASDLQLPAYDRHKIPNGF